MLLLQCKALVMVYYEYVHLVISYRLFKNVHNFFLIVYFSWLRSSLTSLLINKWLQFFPKFSFKNFFLPGTLLPTANWNYWLEVEILIVMTSSVIGIVHKNMWCKNANVITTCSMLCFLFQDLPIPNQNNHENCHYSVPRGSMKVGRMAMHACQIGPTNTAPLAPESTLLGLHQY